jgi:hypothetical protein
MFFKLLSGLGPGLLVASGVAAAPVGAFSDLEVSHSFTINSGNQPSNVDFVFAPGLELTPSIDTTVDAPLTVETPTSELQVGQLGPPAVPFLARRQIVEETLDGNHGAVAEYDVSILSQVDPDEAPTGFITRRTVNNTGAAALTSVDGTVGGAAASGFLGSRFYTLTNTGAAQIGFNVAGQLDAALSARYVGGDGFARTSLSYMLDIEPSAGVGLTYFPTAPYLRDIVDDDAGATVTDSFTTSDGGFALSVATSAIGDGGSATATYDGGFRYVIGITMAPGASLTLNDRWVQANAVAYDGAPMAPIPLPGSLPLLLAAAGGLLALRRRRGT